MWVTSSEKHDPVCNHRDIPFQGLRTWQPFGEKGRTMTTFTIFQLVPAPGQASLERPKSKKTSRVIVFGAKTHLWATSAQCILGWLGLWKAFHLPLRELAQGWGDQDCGERGRRVFMLARMSFLGLAHVPRLEYRGEDVLEPISSHGL